MSQIPKALELLEKSEVIGLPTETVYGLAARVDRPEGLQKIFSVKQRPFFDPLIVHVSSIEQAKSCASQWPENAEVLAKEFWPGPLTLVLPKSDLISPLITSGLTTVGLRCPRHAVALELIEKAGVPLAAPSANRFGRTSPTSAEHVRKEFGDQVFVLDGGACEVGIESTIVAVQGEVLKLLRPGGVSPAQIEAVLKAKGLGFRWEAPSGKTEAPGQMKHHYMPEKPLILFKTEASAEEMKRRISRHLAELPDEVEGVRLNRPTKVDTLIRMTLPDDPALAARSLYQTLRESAAQAGEAVTLVWPESKRTQDWAAVWDRLRKAASLQIEALDSDSDRS